MKFSKWLAPVSAALVSAAPLAARAADKVVIGDIDDMSGVYADVNGPRAVEGIKMAIADFGGSALGQPIEFLTADHQNKPDIGGSKFREWADTKGLTMLLGGSNTGVSLAMAPVAKEKKIPFFAIGAGGASLTGKDCNAYMIHYGYDTTALANGTAKTIVDEGGKSWFFITADYAFGTQLQGAATKVVEAGRRQGDRARCSVPLSTSDFSSYLLQAQGSGAQVVGLANAGADFSNSLKAAHEFGLTSTMKPAALLAFITRHPRDRPRDGAGPLSDRRLVLGPERQEPRLRQALPRQDRRHADLQSGRLLFGDADLSQRGQGRRHDRRRQGDGGAAQDESRRHVHERRNHPRRRVAAAFDVRDAGQDAGGIEGTVGLLTSSSRTMSGEEAFGSLANSTCPLVKK